MGPKAYIASMVSIDQSEASIDALKISIDQSKTFDRSKCSIDRSKIIFAEFDLLIDLSKCSKT